MALDEELLNRNQAPDGSAGTPGGEGESAEKSGQMRAAKQTGKKMGQTIGAEAGKAVGSEFGPLGRAVGGKLGKKAGGMAAGILGGDNKNVSFFIKYGKYIGPVVGACAPCCFMVLAGLIIILLFAKAIDNPFAAIGAVVSWLLDKIAGVLNLTKGNF